MGTGMWNNVNANSRQRILSVIQWVWQEILKNWTHLLAGVQLLHLLLLPTAPGKEQETTPSICSHFPPATSLAGKYKHALSIIATNAKIWNWSDIKGQRFLD